PPGVGDEADSVDHAVVLQVAMSFDERQRRGRRAAIIDTGAPLAVIDADPDHPLAVREPAVDAALTGLNPGRRPGLEVHAHHAGRAIEPLPVRKQHVAAGPVDEDQLLQEARIRAERGELAGDQVEALNPLQAEGHKLAWAGDDDRRAGGDEQLGVARPDERFATAYRDLLGDLLGAPAKRQDGDALGAAIRTPPGDSAPAGPKSGEPFSRPIRNDQPAWPARAASRSKATMLVILIIGFTAGPAVSL